jgi:hypothetical protein
MSGERLNVFATRMTLTMMKNRSKGAKAGHKLLKRKADALTMKFRSMAKVIKDVRGRPFRASCLVSRWAWVHHFEHAGFSAVGVHRAGLPSAGRALRDHYTRLGAPPPLDRAPPLRRLGTRVCSSPSLLTSVVLCACLDRPQNKDQAAGTMKDAYWDTSAAKHAAGDSVTCVLGRFLPRACRASPSLRSAAHTRCRHTACPQ